LIFSANWNAPNRHGRRLESVEPEHRPDPLLYSPVILLDHVVQVFAGSHLYAARQDSRGFERSTLGFLCCFVALEKNRLAVAISRRLLERKWAVSP
jgi:hypothetical protein